MLKLFNIIIIESVKYKVICFDIDGTLYPVEEMHYYIAKLAFFHPIVSKMYASVRAEFRKHQDNFSEIGLENASFAEREAAMVSRVCHKVETTRQGRAFLDEKYYKRLLRLYGTIKKHPEVANTIKKLKQKGCIVGLMTDWPVGDKLKKLELEKLVDFVFTPDEIGFLKPSIHCFEYLLYNLKIKPEEAVYIGDSYVKDVLGAKKAGIDAILMNCSDPDAQSKYTQAVGICKNWAELDALLTCEEN